MAHFALVAPPLMGHLNPTLALADSLRQRGHRTTYFGPIDCADAVTRTGAAFHALGAKSHAPGTLAARQAALGKVSGMRGMATTIWHMVNDTRMLGAQLPNALTQAGCDAVICD
ncbi:MAG: glycosyltransferase, partial [Pseudomonadota bacterium]